MFDNKVFIIAEAGVNHNGSLAAAKKLAEAAKLSGACAVKFQSFHTEKMVCRTAKKADYQLENLKSSDQTQYHMLKRYELSENDQMKLQKYCKEIDILFLSSPFDIDSMTFLSQTLKMPIIKIASGEINNFQLLFSIARTRRQVILSTGMSLLGEIESALSILAFGYLNPHAKVKPTQETCAEAYASEKGQLLLKKNVSLLHCVTAYPAPVNEVNLKVMDTLQSAFNLRTGYSDHTLGIAISLAAVARGAKIIEKHLTLDRQLEGPDHIASLEPDEFRQLVSGIRQIESALGQHIKYPTKSEFKNRQISRKSIVAAKKITEGDFFTCDNITCKRTNNGLSANHYWEIIDHIATQNYEIDESIK